MSLLLNLLITFIIELIVYFIFIRDKKLKIIYYCFLINLFTWPLANILYGFFQHFYLIEILVVLIEWILIFLLFKINWRKGLLISFLANVITAGLSFFL